MTTRFFRYCVTAGLAAMVDLSGFWLFYALSAALVVSAVASWLVAAVVNYAATSRFVFGRSLAWRDAVRFLAGALAGFTINVCTTTGLASRFAVDPVIAKLAGIAIAFGFNFAVNVLWVFHPRATAEPV